MEQNNYLEFEKSKAAVYTIMEACFQDVFDLEDDELGSFHDEIDEYMKQNQEGSWLPENLMITDRFYEWLFEELPYFYVGLLTRPVLVNWLFKVMYESEKKNNKMQAYEVNPEFVDRSFPTEKVLYMRLILLNMTAYTRLTSQNMMKSYIIHLQIKSAKEFIGYNH